MKRCALFFVVALLSGIAVSAQEQTTIQLQCREVAAGETLKPDETLISGKACHPVKQAADQKQTESPTTPAQPTAATSDTKKEVVTQPTVIRQCLILKRMGPADQITSHMYSFGIRGKQFQYVEGDFPSGVKFHGRLTDNDVRKIQSHNARVVIMEPKYSADDLREAKQSCKQP